ncbi:MAG: hypothetical protein KJ721_03310 [Nanoarchaeota archaeon]|nr:hypothetical protein [Nanoarchaeota archaeon]
MESKGKIIYADDKEYMRDIYERIHKKMFNSYKPEFYESGESVKGRLDELVVNGNGCGVIILDNDMESGLSGGELIKEYSPKLGIPIILAFGDCRSVGEKAIENGAYAFVEKPFNLEYFCNVVNNALNSRK